MPEGSSLGADLGMFRNTEAEVTLSVSLQSQVGLSLIKYAISEFRYTLKNGWKVETMEGLMERRTTTVWS